MRKSSIVIFGGYDSFIEEFYLAVKEHVSVTHTVTVHILNDNMSE